MLFSAQKELFDILPGLAIGMVVAKNVDNTRPSKQIDDLLTQAVEDQTTENNLLKIGYFRKQISKFC